MGNPQVWKILDADGLIRKIKSQEPNGQQRISREVEGKLVAVDLSLWLMQAINSADLTKHVHTQTARCVKVVFERVLNCLRFGVVPFFVLEGEADPAKAECLSHRYKLNWGCDRPKNSSQTNSHTSDRSGSRNHGVVVSIVKAMGLGILQAPGEGEATCAALNASNLVDACVTNDSDALLFGAKKLYKTFNLSVNQPKQCELSYCELEKIQHYLGADGPLSVQAMQLLTLLVGGDYNMDGCPGVGPNSAILLVKNLLHIMKGSGSIENAFWNEIEGLNSSMAQEPVLGGCTGCKKCGCDGGRKSIIRHHGRKGCYGCGTQSVAEGGNGKGGCLPGTRRSCACAWHTTKGERDIWKVIKKIQEAYSANTNIRASMIGAWSAYKRQVDKAADAVSMINGRDELGWLHRPDVDKIHEVLEGHLEWDRRMVRSKLLPVLIEWDICHSNLWSPSVSESHGVLLEVVRIKESWKGASSKASIPWRYLLEFKQKEGSVSQEAAEDLQCMKADNEKRCFRIACINKYFPELVSELRERSEGVAQARSRSGRTISKSTSSTQRNKITDYFSLSPRRGHAGDSGTGCRTSEQSQETNLFTRASQSTAGSTRRLQKLYQSCETGGSSLANSSTSQFWTDSCTNQERQAMKGNLSPIEEAMLETPQKNCKPLCMDLSSATKSRVSAKLTVDPELSVVDLLSTPRTCRQAYCPEMATEEVDESFESFPAKNMPQCCKDTRGLSSNDGLDYAVGDDGTYALVPCSEMCSLVVEDCAGELSTPKKRMSIVDLVSPSTSPGNKVL